MYFKIFINSEGVNRKKEGEIEGRERKGEEKERGEGEGEERGRKRERIPKSFQDSDTHPIKAYSFFTLEIYGIQ